MDYIELTDDNFIAKGNERALYKHPTDENKAIKIKYEDSQKEAKQTKIDINYYKELSKRTSIDWTHIPKYYGEVKTNKGNGFVLELIKDYDGITSKSLAYYMNKFGLDNYTKELAVYKEYFLKNSIIFNHTMLPKNILLRKTSETEAHLVLIDGLGDRVFIQFPNKIPYFARKKINKRWDYFAKVYLTGDKVMEP